MSTAAHGALRRVVDRSSRCAGHCLATSGAPRNAAVARLAGLAGLAGPHHTFATADGDLESHAVTFCPEVLGLVLDHLPARSRQRGPIVLQHVDVLGQSEQPIATA